MTIFSDCLATPEQVFEAVNWAIQTVDNSPFSNRRISERITTYLTVNVQLLDQDSKPVGDSFQAITRDISVGGIGLISDRMISGEQLIVQFESGDCSDVPLLMDVRYCNSKGLYFFAGCSFCADWSSIDE